MKASLVLAALIFFLGASLGSIHAQENDYRKALGLISGKLHQRFPNLRGAVVAVKGADLYLSLGEKDKVVKGVKMSVYREGAPFRHPTTGVVLGKLEEEIGEIEVVEVREKFSIARLVRLAPGGRLSPRVKDTVRMSAAKIRLAILPFVNQTKDAVSMETLTRELGRQLLRSGRFDVYDVDRLQVWLLETGIATDEILKKENPIRLRNQVRGDMALENELREIRGKKILSTRLLSLTTKEELFKAVAIADELPFDQGLAPKEQELNRGEGGMRAGPANESFVLAREGAPGRAGGVRSYSFDKVAFRGMSVADVDGDGKNEVILITQTQVIVYRFENNRMREVARFDEGAANDFRWLDVADMNGDGAPEFYLASYRSNELFSLILQFKGGKFTPLVRNDRTFYRLIRVRWPKKGEKIPDSEANILLGQSEGVDSAFDGPIRSYRWSGGKLLSAAFALPPELKILGFGMWDLNKDGALEVIEVGKDDRLRVFSRSGGEIFSSSETYGAPVHKFFSQANTENTSDRIHVPDLPIRSRVLVEDVDRDGVDEVLVIRNEYAVGIAPGLGVTRGQVASLIWDGSGLTQTWRSRKLRGGVVDFAFGDSDNDGFDDLVIAATSSGPLAGEKSQIFFYKLRE